MADFLDLSTKHMGKLLLGCALGSCLYFAVDAPARVLVHSGDVTLLIDGQRLWTPKRVDFKGVQMSTEQSAYGTVANFPGIGIIGSWHVDKGKEEVTELQFWTDGKPLPAPPDKLECRTFRLLRKSKIRGLDLESTVGVHDNRLYETARR